MSSMLIALTLAGSAWLLTILATVACMAATRPSPAPCAPNRGRLARGRPCGARLRR